MSDDTTPQPQSALPPEERSTAAAAGPGANDTPVTTDESVGASEQAAATTATDPTPDGGEADASPEAPAAAEEGAPTQAAHSVGDHPAEGSRLEVVEVRGGEVERGEAKGTPVEPPAAPAPTPAAPAAPPAVPRAQPGHARPTPAVVRPHAPAPHDAATPVVAAPIAPAGAPSNSASFGRVADDGTVYVRTPEGERAVGSYPGASPQEALAYFARKYDEVAASAELLFSRVTQTDLSAHDAADSLGKLRASARDLNAVGDLVALSAKIESIATAVQARKVVENEQKAAQREEALTQREAIVTEAEKLAATPENKVQWKQSSARMRELLDAWKSAQRSGPRLDREREQALWHRLSASRNSFDKMRRVHFAALGQEQAQAKAAKEELVAEAETLSSSTDWGATAGAFKRLMDRWRHAGRAARADDDALWRRFKAAQDAFFAAKDAVSAAEDEEFRGNLAVKEQLLEEARALLPVRDLEKTKQALRVIQDKWDAAGKVPRADVERIEKAMRRVESDVRAAEDKKWASTNPEVAARAASLAAQAEASLARYRRDLEKAEASGDERKITAAREALEARAAWLQQAQAGLAEFGG